MIFDDCQLSYVDFDAISVTYLSATVRVHTPGGKRRRFLA